MATLVGCGDDAALETAPVSGRVTLDGKPLPNVIVNFHFTSETQEFVGSAKTDSDGKYALATGAAVGKNKVFIEAPTTKKDDEFSGDEESGMDAGQLGAANLDDVDAAKEDKSGGLIPAEYGEENSILKVVVPAGGTDTANFALTSSK
ncbi:MAG: hypothetical protein O3A00_13700 [Planctomycetota bacterium]|nr:hypothetical protein [Planctomycetota bacterium]